LNHSNSDLRMMNMSTKTTFQKKKANNKLERSRARSNDMVESIQREREKQNKGTNKNKTLKHSSSSTQDTSTSTTQHNRAGTVGEHSFSERRKGSTVPQHQIVPCASWCASPPTMMDRYQSSHKEWCWRKRKQKSLE